MCCRDSSVWARRARSSANNSSAHEFLDGFRAFEETSKVKETAVYSETDVDVVWQVLFCFTEHDAEEDGEQCVGQKATLLDAVGDEETARQRPIVLHLTFPTFMELAEDGEKFEETAKVRQDFPRSITADSIKVRSTKAAYRPMFCSLHFSCICLSTMIMSTVPLLDLNPNWLYGVFSCAVVGMSLFQQSSSQDFACNGK